MIEPASHQVGLTLLGSRFVLSTTDLAAAGAVRRLWSSFLDPEATRSGQAIQAAGKSTSDRLLSFATAMNAAALDAAPELAIHAGVVSHDDVAIAMPATSGTGKSTMTAACLRCGFGYLSDEALCLRYPDGDVVGYPRPIALSAWSAVAVNARPGTPAGDEFLYTAADFGSTVHTAPTRLGHLVVLNRQPDATPSLTTMSRPEAVTLLLRLSFNHYRRQADAVQLAARVVSGASAWVLDYSDPLAAAELLWSRFVAAR